MIKVGNLEIFPEALLLIDLVSWNNLIIFPFGTRSNTLTARQPSNRYSVGSSGRSSSTWVPPAILPIKP